MDWKSYKKIIKYATIWLALLCIIAMITGIVIKIVTGIYYTQMQEMMVRHPEQEIELIDSFHYYVSVIKSSIIHFGLYSALVITFLLCLFCGIQLAKDKSKKKSVINVLKLIAEQLEQYKKKNYQMIPSFDSLKDDIHKTDEWLNIEYSLRELGYYFSSLSEQMNREESSVKSLITDISHQLKTPLASLKMSHELAQEMNLTYEERREFLKKEEQEIHRLEILLEELVNLSRLENNMIQIKPEFLSIKKTITESVNQVFMKAYRKDITLQVEMEEDINVYHDAKWTV